MGIEDLQPNIKLNTEKKVLPVNQPEGSQDHLTKLLSEIKNLEEKKINIENELDSENKIGNQTPNEFKESIEGILDIEEKINNLNIKKNTLELEKRFGAAKKLDAKEKMEEHSAQMPKGKIESFIKEMKLTELPPEFENLSEEQKLFVIQNLKKRIVDVVKEDAETQYSDYLKEKILNNIKSDNKLAQMFKNVGIGIANVSIKAWQGVKKEFDIKRIEGEVFEGLQNTKDGKKFIIDDMALLSKNAEGQKIGYDKDEKDFHIIYIGTEDISDCTEKEEEAILEFNKVANGFRAIPYEWGQSKKSSKKYKAYSERKAEYEKMRGEIYSMKEEREKPEEKGFAMLKMMQIDSALQMEQLLNTHPEFEKELFEIADKAEDGGKLKALGKTVVNISDTFTGGKGKYNNFTNKIVFGLGFATRTATRFGAATITGAKVAGGTLSSKSAYAISTGVGFVAAPIMGATFGGLRAYHRAKETLLKNKDKGRYDGIGKIATGKINGEISEIKKQLIQAKEDGNKAEVNNLNKSLKKLEKERYVQLSSKLGNKATDITHLTKRFETLTSELELSLNNIDPNESIEAKEKREEKMSLLSVSIQHAVGKMDKGEVNLGDARTRRANNLNYALSLNKAIVLEAALSDKINKETNTRINKLLSYTGKGIERSTSKEEKDFKIKQFWQGAKIGAGAGVAGYITRLVGEELGWWGGHHTTGEIKNIKNIEHTIEGKTIIQTKPTVETNSSVVNTINDNEKRIPVTPPLNDHDGFTKRADNWLDKVNKHLPKKSEEDNVPKISNNNDKPFIKENINSNLDKNPIINKRIITNNRMPAPDAQYTNVPQEWRNSQGEGIPPGWRVQGRVIPIPNNGGIYQPRIRRIYIPQENIPPSVRYERIIPRRRFKIGDIFRRRHIQHRIPENQNNVPNNIDHQNDTSVPGNNGGIKKPEIKNNDIYKEPDNNTLPNQSENNPSVIEKNDTSVENNSYTEPTDNTNQNIEEPSNVVKGSIDKYEEPKIDYEINQNIERIKPGELEHTITNENLTNKSQEEIIQRESLAHIDTKIKTPILEHNTKAPIENAHILKDKTLVENHISHSVINEPKTPHQDQDTLHETVSDNISNSSDKNYHETVIDHNDVNGKDDYVQPENEVSRTEILNNHIEKIDEIKTGENEFIQVKNNINSESTDDIWNQTPKITKFSVDQLNNTTNVYMHNVDYINTFKGDGNNENVYIKIAHHPVGKYIRTRLYKHPINAKQALSNYINKLREVTGIKPKARTIFSSGESADEYINRALQQAETIGDLAKTTL